MSTNRGCHRVSVISTQRKNNYLFPICSSLRYLTQNSNIYHKSYSRNSIKKFAYISDHEYTTNGFNSMSMQWMAKEKIKLFKIPCRNSAVSTTSSGKMAQVTEKVTMDYPRRKIWKVLSEFGNLDWQPNTIEKVETNGTGIGMIRTVHIKGISHPMKEKLLTMDHDNYSFSFSVETNWIIPFENYTIKCHIEKIDNNKCTIVFVGEFQVLGMEEQEGAKMAAGIYKQMFRDLPAYMKKQEM